MTEKHYEWSPSGPYPFVKQHSIAKHEILHAYLIAYVQTLTSHPSQEAFRLTLVDGFCGGGIYRHFDDKREILGSPFTMLNAMREAEFRVNQDRRKKLAFHIDYLFFDEHLGAIEVLTRELGDRGYRELIDEHVFVKRARFQDKARSAIDFIKQKSRSARSIFLLDQYGYSEVSFKIVREILTSLPGSEVILTFAVDSFLNFCSDKQPTQKLLDKIGIPEVLRGRRIDDIKGSDRDWRLFIQSCMYKDLVDACGAKFYTTFFIRSSGGHGDYWLIHLSQRSRARDVMTRVHWEKNNHFIHYGGAGLEMFDVLGYAPEFDSNYTGQTQLGGLGFEFDQFAKAKSIESLTEQIPRLLTPDPHGMTFGELFATTCNSSPASADVYKESLVQLLQFKEIEVISEDGARRKSANIRESDWIRVPRQTRLAI